MEEDKPFATLVSLGERVKQRKLTLGQIEAECVKSGVISALPDSMTGMLEVALYRVLSWIYDLDTEWRSKLRFVKFFRNDDYPTDFGAISLQEMVPSYGRELSYDTNFLAYISMHYDNSGDGLKFMICDGGNMLVYGHEWDEIMEKIVNMSQQPWRSPHV